MKTQYQIIEPVSLSNLLALPQGLDVAVALLSWLVDALRVELHDRLGDAQVDLIRVEYSGAYPAIGVRYRDDGDADLGPLVEATIDDLLKRPSMDFVAFLGRSRTDWRKVTDDLLGTRVVS